MKKLFIPFLVLLAVSPHLYAQDEQMDEFSQFPESTPDNQSLNNMDTEQPASSSLPEPDPLLPETSDTSAASFSDQPNPLQSPNEAASELPLPDDMQKEEKPDIKEPPELPKPAPPKEKKKEVEKAGKKEKKKKSGSPRPKTLQDSSKPLSLKATIEEGFRKNSWQKIRNLNYSLIDLEWEANTAKYWYPNIALSLKTGPQELAHLKSMKSQGQQLNSTERSPTGMLGLSLGDYTLFNWGRDHLEYLINKYNLTRNKEVLDEGKRELKFNLIEKYFALCKVREQNRIRKDQLKHTSFLYRTAKEKLTLRKMTSQDFYLAREAYLKARYEYQNSSIEIKKVEAALQNLLGDTEETVYRPTEALKYEKLTLPSQEAVTLAGSTSPATKDTKLHLENAQREREKAFKENLPLPRISLNLGTYTYAFGRNGNKTLYETNPGDTNIEVVATINMTWDLIGENGFFNSRKIQRANLNEKVAQLQHSETKREVETHIRSLYHTIEKLEQETDILELRVENAHKMFDVILDNYIAGRASYQDMETALVSLKESQDIYEENKYLHLVNKIELARTVGIEDLPGRNFEDLVMTANYDLQSE